MAQKSCESVPTAPGKDVGLGIYVCVQFSAVPTSLNNYISSPGMSQASLCLFCSRISPGCLASHAGDWKAGSLHHVFRHILLGAKKSKTRYGSHSQGWPDPQSLELNQETDRLWPSEDIPRESGPIGEQFSKNGVIALTHLMSRNVEKTEKA